MAARPSFRACGRFGGRTMLGCALAFSRELYLSSVFVAWQVVANRVWQPEPFAGMPNVAAGRSALVVMLIPVLRFRLEPVRMFVAGLAAWTLRTLIYRGMELRFSLFDSRRGAVHILTLGGITCGFSAVFHWMFLF